MSFEKYTASAQGFRAQAENCISVGKSRIGIGTYELPWPYVIIYYDKDIPAIMFVEGNKGNGFKVQRNSGTWYLAAKSFTKLQHIPYGVYERTDDVSQVFKLIKPPTANGEEKHG